MTTSTSRLDSIKAEITTDPLGRGYSAFLPNDPSHVADMLNAYTETMVKPITSNVAMKWAAGGPYAKITDASNDVSSPCRSSCLVLMAAFAADKDIHIEDPDLQTMFQQWLTQNVITQAQYDSLIALATQPASRGEVLGIGYITARDIIDSGAV